MEKLARAIHHAHERGVLHRDLKPDNVLLDEGGEPYLTDFGLAKMLDSSGGLTLTHAQIGTPQYMSPEQARGRASDITAASDVWAAGALFYHMLTGKIPFPGTSSGEILDRVSNEDPLPMEPSPEGLVDGQLETLCLHCLQKDPAQRLPGAEFLAEELGRWLAGEPILTKPLIQLKPAKTKRWPFAALIVIGCLLAGAAAFIAANQDDSPPLQEPDPAGPASTGASPGIDLIQQSRVWHVLLDATEGASQAGVWILPGDTIRFTNVEGGYTYGEDPRIWSAVGDEESGSPAGEGFTSPHLTPWALVGLVRSTSGETDHFPLAEEVEYSGAVAGELSCAINTPVGEAGSAGGFVMRIEVRRRTKIFAKGTDAAQAWGAPMLALGDEVGTLDKNHWSSWVRGGVQYSEGGELVPAGQASSQGSHGLLASNLPEHAVIAKIGQEAAFALGAGVQHHPRNKQGWLHVSVNDEIARPGAYADNLGSLEVHVDVHRPHRTLTRQIILGKVTLRPLSLPRDQNTPAPSLVVNSQTLEAEAKSPQRPAVFLQTEPSAGSTRIALTAIKAASDTYAFMVEGFPSAPSIDTSSHNPYLIVADEQAVWILWTRDLYGRALFQLRPPLAKEPGATKAYSFESKFKEGLFLVVDREGRLRAHTPDGTDAFSRAATWMLEYGEQ
ncbi:MAG: protein kinase, partial [Verrucomicrobiota bacterium]